MAREALAVLGLLMIVAVYLSYALGPGLSALWSHRRSERWLLLALLVLYTLALRALGFEREVDRIHEKEWWINAVGALALAVAGVIVVVGIFAVLFVSLFPNFWSATAGVLALCGYFWLVTQMRRA